MSINRKYLYSFLFFLYLFTNANHVSAQLSTADTLKVYAFIIDGDTIPGGRLLDAEVRTKMHPQWRKYWAEWTRLRNAVYVTYPYAKAAGKIINEVNGLLVNVTDKAERKRL